MVDILAKIMVALTMRLLTDKFLSAMIVHSLHALAEKTENQLDNKLVNDLAAALNVSD